MTDNTNATNTEGKRQFEEIWHMNSKLNRQIAVTAEAMLPAVISWCDHADAVTEVEINVAALLDAGMQVQAWNRVDSYEYAWERSGEKGVAKIVDSSDFTDYDELAWRLNRTIIENDSAENKSEDAQWELVVYKYAAAAEDAPEVSEGMLPALYLVLDRRRSAFPKTFEVKFTAR